MILRKFSFHLKKPDLTTAESQIAPDKYRQRWMGTLIGALFAFMGILLFSGNIFTGISFMHWEGLLNKREYNEFVEFISVKGSLGISITYLLFIVLGGLAGLFVVRAIQRKKKGVRAGFWYGYSALFLALLCGFNCVIIAEAGWDDFARLVSREWNQYAMMCFAVICMSLIPAIVFGPLMGMSIEKLSKTPGFGVAKK